MKLLEQIRRCILSLTSVSKLALKISQEHGSVDEIYPFWLQTKMSKEVDGMPWVPRGLLDSFVKTFYQSNSDTLLKTFFEYGVFWDLT